VPRETLTYCTISRLGLIPVVGREMMESVEDVLVGHTGQAGWGVGPGGEGGGRGGHGCVGVVSGDGERWAERGCGYKGPARDKTRGRAYCPVGGFGKNGPAFGGGGLHKKGSQVVWVPERSCHYKPSDRPIVIVSAHPNPFRTPVPLR